MIKLLKMRSCLEMTTKVRKFVCNHEHATKIFNGVFRALEHAFHAVLKEFCFAIYHTLVKVNRLI